MDLNLEIVYYKQWEIIDLNNDCKVLKTFKTLEEAKKWKTKKLKPLK